MLFSRAFSYISALGLLAKNLIILSSQASIVSCVNAQASTFCVQSLASQSFLSSNAPSIPSAAIHFTNGGMVIEASCPPAIRKPTNPSLQGKASLKKAVPIERLEQAQNRLIFIMSQNWTGSSVVHNTDSCMETSTCCPSPESSR